MLNTPPLSPAPLSPLPAPRRRGGQPSNHNALKHGYFARRNPTPLTQTLNTINLLRPGLTGIVELLEDSLPLLRVQIARLFDTPPRANDLRSVLSWHRPIVSLLGLFLRVNKTLYRCQQPQRQLQFLAAHALALIRYDFQSCSPLPMRSSLGEGPGVRPLPPHSFRGNPELRPNNFLTGEDDKLPNQPHSFLGNPELRHVNSPHLFLTFHQVELLQSLILASEPTGRRGRPTAASGSMLAGICWKLAHHARWQDLTAAADTPPQMRSSFGEGAGEGSLRRRGPSYLYRRLYRSGLLLPLLTALYDDFLAHSGTSLATLVAQGTITLSATAVSLSPEAPDTWQTRTALLLLQLAHQSYRRLQKKIKTGDKQR